MLAPTMKTLSKRKKLEILRKMLKLISADGWNYWSRGLCSAFAETDPDVFDKCSSFDSNLPILGFREREGKYTSVFQSGFWWPMDLQGLEARKRAIRSAIKRLTAKKKKVK